MRTWLVLLRQKNGCPWDAATPRVITAATPDEAVSLAFNPAPSTLHVHDAFVVELVEPYMPYSVPLDVPKPKWKLAVPARPGDRDAAHNLTRLEFEKLRQ